MIQPRIDQHPPRWPHKRELFGVQVSVTDYHQATEAVLAAARRRSPAIVSHHAAAAVVGASGDPGLRRAANSFQIVAPDGQPVRWALNLLHRTGLRSPVTGTGLMLRLCQRAAAEGVSIYLYGSSPQVIEGLQASLRKRYPRLKVAGAESPPFRPLSSEEDRQAVGQINRSGAGIVFVGLGYPKQDYFAYHHRHSIQAVQVCVGAAFDFLSGNRRRAPEWMQRHGLEWLFRLIQEPRRLWRRYLVDNCIFLAKLAAALFHRLPIR